MENKENKKTFSKNKEIFIVIPAFNESRVVLDVIDEIKQCGFNNIILVDDGSQDDTFEKAQKAGVIALKHKINRGKGAATKTGIEAAKLLGADIIVTMDGDGQHDANDIQKLIKPILSGKKDVVLGTRLKDPRGMPFYKRIQNYIANIFTWYLFGLWVTDSQSGFRAYSKKAADLINTKYDRYEYDSEVIREIFVYKLKFEEVAIKVSYTEYSTTKAQKQDFTNGLKTLYKMFLKIIH